MNGGKNENPKKSLDQNLIPKKPHAEFPSHKNFQKASNDITQKIETSVLNTLKNPYLTQATQKFSSPQKMRNPKFRTQKILQSSLSLEIWSTPTPAPLGRTIPGNYGQFFSSQYGCMEILSITAMVDLF